MIGSWDGIDEFVAVAEAGSFTGGARAFGSSVTHVSRSIARLEARIQAQLFHRTTRSVLLTDTGRIFLEQCRRIVSDRDEAIGLISNSSEPQGELRCTCATTLGERYLMPLIMRYCALYPDVQVDIELTNRVIDLIAEGYDLAIRTGHFTDNRLLRTHVGSRRMFTCASPEYLTRMGSPQTINDLGDHRCLQATSTTWHFTLDGREHIMRPKPGWRCNSGVAVAAAAVAGMGICQLPEFYVADHIRSGRLVIVLEELLPEPEPIWAVYPQRRHMMPKLSRLLEILQKDMAEALRLPQ